MPATSIIPRSLDTSKQPIIKLNKKNNLAKEVDSFHEIKDVVIIVNLFLILGYMY